MTQNANDLQYLLDRAAIHDVLARYYQGLDQGDQEKVCKCFTEDVRAKFDDRPLAVGIDALMESFSVFRNHQSGAWKITTHFMGNLNYNLLQGDVAETETNAIAFLVLPDTPKEQVTMRSLRYLDRLRRTPQGWRICERQHTLDWSCHVPTSYSLSIGQRILKRPVL
jgi:ketosteroid isomerase-like protein